MKHKESDLQIRFIKWFRYQYPAYARLIEHPHNEGNAFNRHQQAIAKAEGVTAGVADLILHVPSLIPNKVNDMMCVISTSLAIELKSPTGTQSPEQKIWQRMFEAAGGLYIIGRDFDEMVSFTTRYMLNVPVGVDKAVKDAYAQIIAEEDAKAVALLKKITKE